MNKVICTSCGKEHFVLEYKCIDCGSILREKTSNINLGELLQELLFNIDIGIKKVLTAEHKNYLLIFLILLVVKLSLLTLYHISFLDLAENFQRADFFLKIFSFWFFYLLALCFLIWAIVKAVLKVKIKFKNILSLIVFSFAYFSLSLILLFPLEIMLFGPYLFSNNPSIFEINFSKAVIIVSLEIILIFYSLFLLISFLVFILQSKIKAIFFTSIFFALLFVGNEIIPKILGIK